MKVFKAVAILALPAPFFVSLLYLVPRESSPALLGLFFMLFLWYGLAIIKLPEIKIRWILMAAIAYRLLAVVPLPTLSDDYFRFLWDGQLLSHGQNPFLQLPSEVDKATYEDLGLSDALYQGLNSKDYFTIYPPLNQAIFSIAARVGEKNIHSGAITLKVFILFAEIINLLLLYALLALLKKPAWWIGLYALNPLVIIELVGNIHFEAWMICGILGCLYLLLKGKWLGASLMLGLGIASKLLPIMLIPLVLRRIGFWKTLTFGIIAVSTGLLGFLLIPDPSAVFNIIDSVRLYFENFEFNASIFQWLSWLGLRKDILGPALTIIPVAGILYMSFSKKHNDGASLAIKMLFAFSLYFLCARIVHPWYICTLVALASLGPWRYPMAWTAVLPLTYLSYQTPLYHQPYMLMLFAYAVLLAFFTFEYIYLNRKMALTKSSENI